MNRVNQSFNNTLWGFAYRFLRMLVPTLFRAYIIRYVGTQYVGLSGFFTSFLSVLSLSELGFGSAIIFLMYEPIAKNDYVTLNALLKKLRRIYVYVGIVIILVGCAFYPFLDVLIKIDTETKPNIQLLYAMYLFQVAASYLMFAYRYALLTAYQRSDIVFKIEFIYSLIEYALKFIILITTKNFYLHTLVFALMIIPKNIAYYTASKKLYPNVYCNGTTTKEQNDYIKAKVISLFGHRIGATFMFSIDSVIISAFLGITILAKFDNYNHIMRSVVTFLGVLLTSIVASLGNKLILDSNEKTYDSFKNATFIWIVIVGWCTNCFLCLFQPFIKWWVGEQLVVDEYVMITIAVYFFCWQFRQIGLTMKDAAGLWEQDKLKPYIGMILNIGLSVLLVLVSKNIIGVLIPTICILVFLYFPWETKVLFNSIFQGKQNDYFRFMSRTLISTLIAVVVTYLVARIMPDSGFGAIALRGVLCCIMMPSTFIVLNLRNPQYDEAKHILVYAVKRKMHRK